ncbi:MAG: 5'-methylthioadenosine/adenosylhomocysteine nucleosidase [Coriobacteriales bacterium]|nr:5'-methylthioadenosine/adenosylhomocysteine nucleosidase [Coriobacteriales bacterium]
MLKRQTIGIIAAMDREVKLIVDEIESLKTQTIAKYDYYTGKIGRYDVVVVRCGIGKVSAALCTQIMIDKFEPDLIINNGCAGALNKELKIGDIVVASHLVQWDMDLTPLGAPRGHIDALDKIRIPVCEEIADLMHKQLSEHKVLRGLVATGDSFIATDDQRNHILLHFEDALCAEMEGGAIAHVAHQNNVDFCVIRSISDSVGDEEAVEYTKFADHASEISAKALIKILKA